MERPWLKFYETAVNQSPAIPEKTIYDLFEDAVRLSPKQPALLFFGRKFSFAELARLVEALANALAGLGVRGGDRVAIILPNLPQYVVAHYAIMKIGAIVVPTNPLYVERELEHQLNDSGAEVAIGLDLLCKRIEAVRAKTRLRAVIYTGVHDYLPAALKILYPFKARREGRWVSTPSGSGVYRFMSLMKQPFPPIHKKERQPRDTAMLLYTGGTTGVAKGAVLTHRNLVANLVQIQAWCAGAEIEREVLLSVLPFFHSYGLTTCLHFSLVIRCILVLVPRFDVEMILKAIDRHQVTLFPGVPTMYVAVNNYARIKKYDLKKIKLCISGAAPLPLEVATTFEKMTAGGRLVEGYGLSECSPVTHCNPIFGERREGSIGLPLPLTDARIVDPETRETLPPGEAGELAVAGPQVMQGYWQMPGETAAVLRDGWLFTGDLARMDRDGYFYIVDRKKDMIIAGGFNIYPREIEEVLFKHPKVLEAAVIGVKDRYRGETVKAFVVLREGAQATEEEIVAFCKKEMAVFKVPKLIEFRKELPKTLIGKVLRRALAEEEKSKTVKAASTAAAEVN
jgi:long-chain acyl-CoA synthetase